jgi:hypothetical protein
LGLVRFHKTIGSGWVGSFRQFRLLCLRAPVPGFARQRGANRTLALRAGKSRRSIAASRQTLSKGRAPSILRSIVFMLCSTARPRQLQQESHEG